MKTLFIFLSAILAGCSSIEGIASGRISLPSQVMVLNSAPPASIAQTDDGGILAVFFTEGHDIQIVKVAKRGNIEREIIKTDFYCESCIVSASLSTVVLLDRENNMLHVYVKQSNAWKSVELGKNVEWLDLKINDHEIWVIAFDADEGSSKLSVWDDSGAFLNETDIVMAPSTDFDQSNPTPIAFSTARNDVVMVQGEIDGSLALATGELRKEAKRIYCKINGAVLEMYKMASDMSILLSADEFLYEVGQSDGLHTFATTAGRRGTVVAQGEFYGGVARDETGSRVAMLFFDGATTRLVELHLQ